MSDPPQHSDATSPMTALAATGFAFRCSMFVRSTDISASSLTNRSGNPPREQICERTAEPIVRLQDDGACHHSTRTAGSSSGFTGALGLDRRAWHRTVGAEHATVTLLRTQHRAAPGALVEELAGVGRHTFRFGGSGKRACDDRFKDHSACLKHVDNIRRSGRIREHCVFDIVYGEIVTDSETEQ